MPAHIFTKEEELNIKKGFFDEKLPLIQISEKYNIGMKPLRRYIKENNMVRDNIQKQSCNFIDETGNRYGRLLVIENLHKKDSDNRNLFLCKCDCGNIIEVSGKKLRSGNTKSCGCLQKEKAIETLKTKTKNGDSINIDLTGKKFGKLLVIKEVEGIQKSNGKNMRQWLCQCDCGNSFIAQHTYLTTGQTKSCGCLISQGVFEIENCLINNNINYTKEYSFNDLREKNLLRFDFAILNEKNQVQYLIEFDGEQHYKDTNGFYSIERVKVDMKKNKYCLDNNICLIRIPYSEREKISISQLIPETSNFIVKEINHYKIKELGEDCID